MKLFNGLHGSRLLPYGLILLLPLFWIWLNRFPKPQNQTRKQTSMIAAQNNQLRRLLRSSSNLNEFGIELLVAQARHETGNYTSAIFAENHNYFGMKHPRVRKTTSKGVNRGHAKYDSKHDSVIDMLYYLQHFSTNPGDFANVESYVRELKNDNYFEDSEANYLRGMRAHLYGGFALRPSGIVPLRRWINPLIINN